MICTSCHLDIKNSVKRCPACGSEKIVSDGETYGVSWGINAAKSRRVTYLLALIIIFAPIIVLGLLWSFLPQQFQYEGGYLSFMVIAILMLLAIIAHFTSKQRKYKQRVDNSHWHEAEGKVIDYKTIAFINKSYYEIIEFTAKGKRYRHVSSYAGDPSKKGEKRPIKYNPQDPTDSEVVGNNRNIEIIVMMIVIAVLITIFTIALATF